jgi:cytochrome c2
MSYRKLFYAFNFAMLAAFAWSFWLDFDTEWRVYQKKYYSMAADVFEKKAAAAKNEDEKKTLLAEAKKMRSSPVEIKQIINRDLKKFDRCTTCHVGMDEYTNPTLKNDFAEHPYKAHPKVDFYGKNHPFQKYGCTVCHSGQGLATTAKAAHGRIHHWEKPMYEGKIVQASCVKCHQNFEKLPGAEFAAKGKQEFYKHGCQGCHSIKGQGGIVSVDLGDIADKPLERIAGFNFSRVEIKGKHLDSEDWNIQNWILGHLVNDPMHVTPNDPHAEYNAEPIAPSGMPNFTDSDVTGKRELSEENAEAITAWLMSMSAEPLPHTFVVSAPKAPEPTAGDAAGRGKIAFEKYGCAGCHGLGGAKGRRNYNALGPGQSDLKADMDKGREPTLVDVVGTYTHEELVKKIATGVPASAISKFNPNGPVPPLYMPPWKDKIKPQELNDLATYLLSIAKKQDVGF